jgi:hypothetical protein
VFSAVLAEKRSTFTRRGFLHRFERPLSLKASRPEERALEPGSGGIL